MKKILLVGGDSRLAKIFFKKYKYNKNFKIFRTTRRLNKKNFIFLNFSDISKYHHYNKTLSANFHFKKPLVFRIFVKLKK